MNKINRRIAEFYGRGKRYGIEVDDLGALRRIEMTLHRWAEHECNGTIQRDGYHGDGAPFWYYETMDGHRRGSRVPDRERGALARLRVIMARYPNLWWYHQGDPRGCALYIGTWDSLPGGNALLPKFKDPEMSKVLETLSAHYSSHGFAVGY